jgi:hypothetical protein
MSYFKRRIKDSLQVAKLIFSCVTWKNAIITIPGFIVLIPFVWFFMLFDDYEERAKEHLRGFEDGKEYMKNRNL